MSAFSTLLALINAQIKTNGLKAITGAKLNGVLVQMVNELGSGYQFIDIATPATDPGTPDENVWYIASQAGTYTNFGGIIVNENEVCALVWNGTWTKKVTGAATAAQVNQLGQEVGQLQQNNGLPFITNADFPLYATIITNNDVEDGDIIHFSFTSGQIIIYVGETIVEYIEGERDYTIPSGFTKATASLAVIGLTLLNKSIPSNRTLDKKTGDNKTLIEGLDSLIKVLNYNNGLEFVTNKSVVPNEVVLTSSDVVVGTRLFVKMGSGQLSFYKTGSDSPYRYAGEGDTWVDIPADFDRAKCDIAGTITSITAKSILTNNALKTYVDDLIAKSLTTNERIIGYDTTTLTDMNNAVVNKVYYISPSNYIPSNFHPQMKIYTSADVEYAITLFFKYFDGYQGGFGWQIIFDFMMKPVWFRQFTRDNSGVNTWTAWGLCLGNRYKIEVGSGKYFTTLKSAINFAWQYSTPQTNPYFFTKPACFDIIVGQGEYDIITEMGGVDNWNEADTYEGYKIGLGMRLYFLQGSKVLCNYTGSNATIQTYFSPFRTSYGSVEIYGLDIEARNVRYCIHDEKGGADDTPAYNIFKDCKFKFTKDSSYVGDIPSHSCIGGGLGNKTNVLVENCVFDGGQECQDTDSVLSYHMPVRGEDSACYVVFKSNYCKTGTIVALSVASNTTEEKSPFIVTNNSVKSAPYYTIDTNDNVDFMSWNNDVRN